MTNICILEKECRNCKEVKPVTQFRVISALGATYHRCKRCECLTKNWKIMEGSMTHSDLLIAGILKLPEPNLRPIGRNSLDSSSSLKVYLDP